MSLALDSDARRLSFAMLEPMEPWILPYGDFVPAIAPDAWVAPGAVVIGDTLLGPGAVVLFGCVVRGDVNRIEVGEGSNIQDLERRSVP